MGQPSKTEQNLDRVYGNTGSNVTESKVDGSKSRIMRATGDLPSEDKVGFAKASPNFKKVEPDAKVVASEDAQKKALEENVIQEGLNADSDDSNDQN